jgi:hypothetical protein
VPRELRASEFSLQQLWLADLAFTALGVPLAGAATG